MKAKAAEPVDPSGHSQEASYSLKPSVVQLLWLLAMVLSAFGCYLVYTLQCATWGFMRLGVGTAFLIGSIPLLLAVLPLTTLAFFVVKGLTCSLHVHKNSRLKWLIGAAVLPFLILIGFGINSMTGKSRFANHVCRPVPESVSQVQAYGFNAFLATRWLVVFAINPEDAGRIVRQRSLRPVPAFDLRNMLARDAFFMSKSNLLAALPTATGVNCFSDRRPDQDNPATQCWLVVEQSGANAWFFSSYQN